MFETKKDYNETEMRTLIELLYGSIAIKEQALSSNIFLWAATAITVYQCSNSQDDQCLQRIAGFCLNATLKMLTAPRCLVRNIQ